MSRNQLYICDSLSDHVVTKDHIYELMEEEEVEQVSAYIAIRLSMKWHFHCNWSDEPSYSDEGICGKHCEGYKPRNGKTGLCLHKRHSFQPGRELTITLPKEIPTTPESLHTKP
jgi:hypothetical protein